MRQQLIYFLWVMIINKIPLCSRSVHSWFSDNHQDSVWCGGIKPLSNLGSALTVYYRFSLLILNYVPMNFSNWDQYLFIYYWIWGGVRGRERLWLVVPSIYAFMHSLLFLAWALMKDRTCNVGVSEWCSNQLSYMARATFMLINYCQREREREREREIIRVYYWV